MNVLGIATPAGDAEMLDVGNIVPLDIVDMLGMLATDMAKLGTVVCVEVLKGVGNVDGVGNMVGPENVDVNTGVLVEVGRLKELKFAACPPDCADAAPLPSIIEPPRTFPSDQKLRLVPDVKNGSRPGPRKFVFVLPKS
jgi:hypothetical protein